MKPNSELHDPLCTRTHRERRTAIRLLDRGAAKALSKIDKVSQSSLESPEKERQLYDLAVERARALMGIKLEDVARDLRDKGACPGSVVQHIGAMRAEFFAVLSGPPAGLKSYQGDPSLWRDDYDFGLDDDDEDDDDDDEENDIGEAPSGGAVRAN